MNIKIAKTRYLWDKNDLKQAKAMRKKGEITAKQYQGVVSRCKASHQAYEKAKKAKAMAR